MQSIAEPAPSKASVPESASFAGFLSALAVPLPAPQTAPAASVWNDDALADDVATLSYERALRAHSRYRPLYEPDEDADASQHKISTRHDSIRSSTAETHPVAFAAGQPKSASITIRMSQAECTQLKERAAEAGMTISAYLRSCTFEADALRSQVKEALAQLRAGTQEAAIPVPKVKQRGKVEPRGLFGWLLRFFPRYQLQQPAQS